MHVLCKKCKAKIIVAGKPGGSTRVSGVQVKGNVRIDGGQISFGPGGSISFGPGGGISFGSPLILQRKVALLRKVEHDYEILRLRRRDGRRSSRARVRLRCER